MDNYWAMPLEYNDRAKHLIVVQCESKQHLFCFLGYYFGGKPFDCGLISENTFKVYSNCDKTDECKKYLSEHKLTNEVPIGSLYGCTYINEKDKPKQKK